MNRAGGWWSFHAANPIHLCRSNRYAMAITLMKAGLIFVAAHIALLALAIILFPDS